VPPPYKKETEMAKSKQTIEKDIGVDIPTLEDTLDFEKSPELRRTNTKDIPEKNKGRPKKVVKRNKKESAAIMREYRDRMLASPKSVKVLNAIWDAALDPEDKDRAAAWRIVTGTIMPQAVVNELFEGNATRAAVQINITGLNDVRTGVDIDGDSGEVL